MLVPPGFAVPPDRAALRSDIQQWVGAEALLQLISAFGGPTPMPGNADVSELADWSGKHWDFRAGRERNLVDVDTITDELESLVLDAADALGLVDAQPPSLLNYDHVLMLGGLVRACVLRPEYAAHLIAEGATARAVAAITGFRGLNEAELELLPAFGLGPLEHEHQVMDWSLRKAFGVDTLKTVSASDPLVEPNLRCLVESAVTADGVPVNMVVAPSREPTRRANTADGYEYWAQEVAHVQPGDRILMVTSSIYVPFQHTDAVRTLGLPHGCVIETVGIDPALVDDRGEPQIFRGVNYLQELNSMLRSLRALSETLKNS